MRARRTLLRLVHRLRSLAARALAPVAAQRRRVRADLARLVSAIPAAGNQQADYAHDPAISGNGRYVVFDGSYGGRTGVWRRDLQTGAVLASRRRRRNRRSAHPTRAAVDQRRRSLRQLHDDAHAGSARRHQPRPGRLRARHGPGRTGRTGRRTHSRLGRRRLERRADLRTDRQIRIEDEETALRLAGGRALGDQRRRRKVAFVTTAISNLAGPEHARAAGRRARPRHRHDTELVSVAENPATGQPLPRSAGLGARKRTRLRRGLRGVGGAADLHRARSPTNRRRWSAPRSAPTARPSRGWASTSPSRRSCSPAKRRSTNTPSRCGGASPTVRRRRRGGSPAARTRQTRPAPPAARRALPATASLADPCQGPFAATQEGDARESGEAAAAIPCRGSARDGYTVAFLANAPLVASQGPGGERTQQRPLPRRHARRADPRRRRCAR